VHRLGGVWYSRRRVSFDPGCHPSWKRRNLDGLCSWPGSAHGRSQAFTNERPQHLLCALVWFTPLGLKPRKRRGSQSATWLIRAMALEQSNPKQQGFGTQRLAGTARGRLGGTMATSVGSSSASRYVSRADAAA